MERRNWLFYSAITAVLLSSCAQHTSIPTTQPIKPRTLGLLEVHFQDAGSATPTVTARFIPRNGAAGISKQDLGNVDGMGIDIDLMSRSSFTLGTRGQPSGKRYITATWKVRNASQDGSTPSPVDRTNLSLVAVDTPSTINETAVTSLKKFDDSAASAALAEQILPINGLIHDPISGVVVQSNRADFQVYTEQELTTLPALPAGETALAYGYVVRNTDGSRTLPALPAAGQYDGVITLGVQYPLQTDPKDDPYSFSLMFEVMENTRTQVAISPEEDYTSALNRVNTYYGTAGYAVPADVREFCQVRVAGTNPLSPTVDLVNPALSTGQRDACWNADVLGDGWAVVPSISGTYQDAAMQSTGQLVAVTSSNLYRLQPDGTVDTAFTPVLSAPNALTGVTVKKVMVLADDAILVAGHGQDAVNGNYTVFVEKFLSNGTPDTSFDGDGLALLSYSALDHHFLEDMNVQSDGKITLSGSVQPYLGATLTHTLPFLSRLNANGSSDAAFGDIRSISDGATDSHGFQHVIQSTGKIVMAGQRFFSPDDTNYHSLVRFDATGTLDTAFSTDGFAGNEFSGNGVLEAFSDDSVVVTNNAGDLQKYLAEGARVVAFSIPATSNFQVLDDQIYRFIGATIQRYSASGVLDGTFGDFELSRFGQALSPGRLNKTLEGKLLVATQQSAIVALGNTISATKIIP